MAGPEIYCWRCGETLESIPRPFSRFAECPNSDCRVELHVCRMCRHFNPRYTGQCDHDFADKVFDKEKSNFCSYFRPRFGTHDALKDDGKASARESLDRLFGEDADPESAVEDTEEPKEPKPKETRADIARRELDDLFGPEDS